MPIWYKRFLFYKEFTNVDQSFSPEVIKEFERQWKIISRGAVDILPEGEFQNRLKKSIADNKPLRVKQGFDPSVSAIGIAGAALTALSQYSQIIEARGQMRKNPFYAIWSLQKGKGPKNKFSQRHYISKQTPSQNFNKNEIPLYHWLSPPTPGWNIPTAIRV